MGKDIRFGSNPKFVSIVLETNGVPTLRNFSSCLDMPDRVVYKMEVYAST